MSAWRTPQQAYADQERRRGLTESVALLAPRPFSLTLPWPPTLNHSGANSFRGGAKTVEYRDFMQHVAMLVLSRRIKPLTGRLSISIIATPPDERTRDLDNIIKPVLDALQRAGCFPNDGAIDHLEITRLRMGEPSCVTVSVMEISA